MKTKIFSTAYCPPIDYIKEFITSKNVILEKWENFQKQTYRTRCYIYSPNGKQMLNIPIKHSKNKQGRKLINEAKIDYSENWQKQHLKSLETCYRSSPFYEFYEYKIMKFYTEKFENLFQFNLEFLKIILKILKCNIKITFTESYKHIYQKEILDLRNFYNSKENIPTKSKKYFQLFSKKNGFIPNLSILDLIFIKGNSTLDFLID